MFTSYSIINVYGIKKETAYAASFFIFRIVIIS